LEGGINLFVYVAGNPTTLIDPLGLVNPFSWLYWNMKGPILVTDMSDKTTTFYPGFFNKCNTCSIETRNDIDKQRSLPGAQDPFTTPDVTPIDTINSPSYGPPGAYINTGDPRGRDIHGGGSSLPDPFAPRQGWLPTYGCTRGQNEDVQALAKSINEFKKTHKGVKIPYVRKK
jgi:hypothetical protein